MQSTISTIASKLALVALCVFCLTGCSHTNPVSKAWIMPDEPKTLPVEFKKSDGGTFITRESTVNLAKNLNEYDAYITKLEILIKEMKEYYKKK